MWRFTSILGTYLQTIAQTSQKKLANREVIVMNRFAATEETASKVNCFVGFFHHPVLLS